ncbi:LOB domain-containing protein 37 [Raphanus sativus]|uniref:LOB domain-containing protein 37 n=1 Tax=Raphanus sativus TaxID=3726 RepID=A0A6J0JN85_RAPSA|nr:LOB domain-containing protein 37 [Raphanus sativus]KAJ4887577.1 LOB domain-containing protein 37 [Raphanus sativus]
MSCNGCRVLRKGCSENCILRPCLQWIETADAQGHATVFVAKFFGRAGLMSFISAVPESQRPALFQSLLYEACGRTVNPVNGAIGMLWTGSWSICQAAVETVLRGGSLRPIPELLAHGGGFAGFPSVTSEEASEICTEKLNLGSSDRSIYHHSRFSSSRSRSTLDSPAKKRKRVELDLSLNPDLPIETVPSSTRQRSRTPSMNSEEESVTTTSFPDNNATGERYGNGGGGEARHLLNLFV